MRSIHLLAFAATNLTLLCGCSLDVHKLREQYRLSECPPHEVEGYPDCQNQHDMAFVPVSHHATADSGD